MRTSIRRPAATIPPMRYTDNDPVGLIYNRDRDTLQICSIKVASIRRGLHWPLDVFGMVIVRDVLEIDRKRNIVFARARSNCQTITEEVIICIYVPRLSYFLFAIFCLLNKLIVACSTHI